jgi:hypothetical protein
VHRARTRNSGGRHQGVPPRVVDEAQGKSNGAEDETEFTHLGEGGANWNRSGPGLSEQAHGQGGGQGFNDHNHKQHECDDPWDIHKRLSAMLGVDLPVSIVSSGEQIVPTYRVRAALTWSF